MGRSSKAKDEDDDPTMNGGDEEENDDEDYIYKEETENSSPKQRTTSTSYKKNQKRKVESSSESSTLEKKPSRSRKPPKRAKHENASNSHDENVIPAPTLVDDIVPIEQNRKFRRLHSLFLVIIGYILIEFTSGCFNTVETNVVHSELRILMIDEVGDYRYSKGSRNTTRNDDSVNKTLTLRVRGNPYSRFGDFPGHIYEKAKKWMQLFVRVRSSYSISFFISSCSFLTDDLF
jgi:DNA mismatch repair ATPase MutL